MLHEDRRTFMTNAVNDVTTGFISTKITKFRVVAIGTLLTRDQPSSAVVTLMRRKYFALGIF
jgi:hypothetical protein